ncbi:retrovirus-related Pol polyprotein from transposon opus [Trichonephila clavipes]|nr:retrovirus-related Pol polyprotein from transposon opus [Trichonephila clavipes]
MGPKKTLERIKYSLFWEGLSSNVKKFCESCKECQLTRSVRIKDRSPITPVARSELPFQVVNMDLIGPIDPPSSKGHTYILCLVDQHTRWGEDRPVTSLSAKFWDNEGWICVRQYSGDLSLSKKTSGLTPRVMQDSACPHVAKAVPDFCLAQHMQLLLWPAYSLDMSSIENVWDLIGRHLSRDPRPAASKDDLLLRMQAI